MISTQRRKTDFFTGAPPEKIEEIILKAVRKQQTLVASTVEAKENKEAVMLELEQLANYKAELHDSCDFVMKNFEIRQTARDEEIEAGPQISLIGNSSNVVE